MAKITIELDDNLEDDVDQAIEGVKEALEEYLAENKPNDVPCLNNDLDYSGSIHELVDGIVPVYTRELDIAYFLHGNELESAFDSHGLDDDGTKEGHISTAYYCYLMDAVNEWYSDNAQDIYDAWVESGQNDYSVGDEVIFTHPETEEQFQGEITEFNEGFVVITNGMTTKTVNACDLAMYEAPEDE